MRLFVGIDIDEQIRARIEEFSQRMRKFAPDTRWAKPETFHVTLKFLGETPAPDAERVKQALAGVECAPIEITFEGAGFFPNGRSARVFWIGLKADETLPQLARDVDAATAQLGFPREQNAYKPHLTLARAGSSGNPHQKPKSQHAKFVVLWREIEKMPPPTFGTMTAREFHLYESKLSPAGARYSKIARFDLRGRNS